MFAKRLYYFNQRSVLKTLVEILHVIRIITEFVARTLKQLQRLNGNFRILVARLTEQPLGVAVTLRRKFHPSTDQVHARAPSVELSAPGELNPRASKIIFME